MGRKQEGEVEQRKGEEKKQRLALLFTPLLMTALLQRCFWYGETPQAGRLVNVTISKNKKKV